MAGRGVCGRCGARRRGRGARVQAPVADCVDCRTPLCVKHAIEAPDRGGYICFKCKKKPQAQISELPELDMRRAAGNVVALLPRV